MVSGRLGLAGAHALKSATVPVMVLEVDLEPAQTPLRRLEARHAGNIRPWTIIAGITVLVSAVNVKCRNHGQDKHYCRLSFCFVVSLCLFVCILLLFLSVYVTDPSSFKSFS